MKVQPGVDRKAQPGVELIVHVTPASLTVLRAAPVSHVPRLWLREPRLTAETAERFRPGDAELVLTIADQSGRSMRSFGWPARGYHFVDWISADEDTLLGGPREVRTDQRDLRSIKVPLPAGAAYLMFHRTERPLAPSTLPIVHVPLALSQLPDAPPLPHRIHPFPTVPLPPVPIVLAPPWLPGSPRPLLFEPAVPAADGVLRSATTVVDNGPAADRFDIVITGDGFQPAEMPTFFDAARRLVNGLGAMPPFSAVGPLINWHLVEAESVDSGIYCCSENGPGQSWHRRTFFGVEGCRDPQGSVPGFLGTDHPERVILAAEQVAAWEHIELVIVLANCGAYGGHAYPAMKLAVVPLHNVGNVEFLRLTAHESGHVISWLADERIVCVRDDPFRPDPNKASLMEVGASVKERVYSQVGPTTKTVLDRWHLTDSVWWRELARVSGDLGANGRFKIVRLLGDPASQNDASEPSVPPGSEDAVGAFAGCQSSFDPVTMPAPADPAIGAALQELSPIVCGAAWPIVPLSQCDQYWDPTGATFFRSNLRCRMRRLKHEFCRACAHVLANTVRDA